MAPPSLLSTGGGWIRGNIRRWKLTLCWLRLRLYHPAQGSVTVLDFERISSWISSGFRFLGLKSTEIQIQIGEIRAL
ncbi:hypothetical protein C8R46DRAFT_255524 [Mycena filopes]|nr:hypothetical protein C8R46DRAFT_255524 [Mycena filopes]